MPLLSHTCNFSYYKEALSKEICTKAYIYVLVNLSSLQLIESLNYRNGCSKGPVEVIQFSFHGSLCTWKCIPRGHSTRFETFLGRAMRLTRFPKSYFQYFKRQMQSQLLAFFFFFSSGASALMLFSQIIDTVLIIISYNFFNAFLWI